MATMVLDCSVLPEPLLSCFRTPRIAAVQQPTGDVTLSPIIDPDDYDNDTDYINAIPGMVDRLLALRDAPDSEWESVPEECFHV